MLSVFLFWTKFPDKTVACYQETNAFSASIFPQVWVAEVPTVSVLHYSSPFSETKFM